jgi:hypothetical protein
MTINTFWQALECKIIMYVYNPFKYLKMVDD